MRPQFQTSKYDKRFSNTDLGLKIDDQIRDRKSRLSSKYRPKSQTPQGSNKVTYDYSHLNTNYIGTNKLNLDTLCRTPVNPSSKVGSSSKIRYSSHDKHSMLKSYGFNVNYGPMVNTKINRTSLCKRDQSDSINSSRNLKNMLKKTGASPKTFSNINNNGKKFTNQNVDQDLGLKVNNDRNSYESLDLNFVLTKPHTKNQLTYSIEKDIKESSLKKKLDYFNEETFKYRLDSSMNNNEESSHQTYYKTSKNENSASNLKSPTVKKEMCVKASETIDKTSTKNLELSLKEFNDRLNMLEQKLTVLEVKKDPITNIMDSAFTEQSKNIESHTTNIGTTSEKIGINLKSDNYVKTQKEEIVDIKLKSVDKTKNANYSIKLNSIINIDSTGSRSSEPIIQKAIKNENISDIDNRFNAILENEQINLSNKKAIYNAKELANLNKNSVKTGNDLLKDKSFEIIKNLDKESLKTRINNKTGINLTKNEKKFETRFCKNIPVNNEIQFMGFDKNLYNNDLSVSKNNKSTTELKAYVPKPSPEIKSNFLTRNEILASTSYKLEDYCFLSKNYNHTRDKISNFSNNKPTQADENKKLLKKYNDKKHKSVNHESAGNIISSRKASETLAKHDLESDKIPQTPDDLKINLTNTVDSNDMNFNNMISKKFDFEAYKNKLLETKLTASGQSYTIGNIVKNTKPDVTKKYSYENDNLKLNQGISNNDTTNQNLIQRKDTSEADEQPIVEQRKASEFIDNKIQETIDNFNKLLNDDKTRLNTEENKRSVYLEEKTEPSDQTSYNFPDNNTKQSLEKVMLANKHQLYEINRDKPEFKNDYTFFNETKNMDPKLILNNPNNAQANNFIYTVQKKHPFSTNDLLSNENNRRDQSRGSKKSKRDSKNTNSKYPSQVSFVK